MIEKQIMELLNNNLIILGAEIVDVNSKLFRQYYLTEFVCGKNKKQQ